MIPAELRRAAGLPVGEVSVVVGSGHHVEIWSTEWGERMQRRDDCTKLREDKGMSYRPALVRLTLSNGAIDEIHIADIERQEAVLSRLRFGRIFHEPLFIDTPGTTATYRANAIVRIDIDLCTSLLEGLRSKFPAELREVEANEPLLNPGLDRDATTMRMEFAGAGSVRLQATYPKPSPMEQRMFLRQFAEAEFLFFQTQAGYTLLNMTHLVATYFTPGVDSLPTGAWHADAAPTPEPVA